MAERKDNQAGLVSVGRVGLNGLIAGIAPEDGRPDGLLRAWNMRADRLGRLNVRPGYSVRHHSLESGGDRIDLTMQVAHTTPVGDVLAVGTPGTNALRFYCNGTEKLENTGAYTVSHVRGAYVSNELVPINLVAVNGQRLFKQYYSSNYTDYVVARMPSPTILLSGATAADEGVGTFLKTETYNFACRAYNYITGEENGGGAQKSHTPTNNNVGIKLTDIPLATGDEASDTYRRIYCFTTTDQIWYLLDTIEDNTTTELTLTAAPTAEDSLAVYQTAPPLPGTFACIAHWLGYTWVATDTTLYFSIDAHSLMFDTANNLVALPGMPYALVGAPDRLVIFTSAGIYYIPRPNSVTTSTLNLIKLNSDIIRSADAHVPVLCGNQIIYRDGERIATVDGDELSTPQVNSLLQDVSDEYYPTRSLGHYDSERDRFMMPTRIRCTNSAPNQIANRDVLIYDRKTQKWWWDTYEGLWITSICTISDYTQKDYGPLITIGTPYGVVAHIEGGRKGSGSVVANYLYDGKETSITTYLATGGSTTTIESSGVVFPDADIGCSAVVLRASVSGYATQQWRYMGVAPIKSLAGGNLTLGHSIGFTVAAGDIVYIGAIPWLMKLPAVAAGNQVVKRVHVSHAGAYYGLLVVPDSPERETMRPTAATGLLQQILSDTRTGLHSAVYSPNMRSEAPCIQLCGVRPASNQNRPIIAGLRIELEELPEF